MKTKEELNALKEEVEAVDKKLHELTEEELAQVSGGKCPWDMSIQDESVPVRDGDPCPRCGERVQVVTGQGGQPLYLLCPNCSYTYTPTDGKFYSYDL